MSVDGCIDDATPRRLLLSNDEDFDRVDAERAQSDAILVGANTIRRDDPVLLVRSKERQAARASRGLSTSPIKVTITRTGNLDPSAKFFTNGNVVKLVYCTPSVTPSLAAGVGGVATVIGAGDPLDLVTVLADLWARGVRRLLVEGGGTIHTQFLAAGLADELHLVIAPVVVGDDSAPRFRGGRASGSVRPVTLVETRRMGDRVLLRYVLSAGNDA